MKKRALPPSFNARLAELNKTKIIDRNYNLGEVEQPVPAADASPDTQKHE